MFIYNLLSTPLICYLAKRIMIMFYAFMNYEDAPKLRPINNHFYFFSSIAGMS